MYKNKFKIWRWSKNLPHGVAVWMTEKARERTPKETVFTWNEQKWTDKKIVHKYGKTLNNQVTTGICAPTPSDVTYETPKPFVGDTWQPGTFASRSQNLEGEQEGKSIHYLDLMPVHMDLSQTTLADLRRLLDRARRAASAGAIDDADTDFRDAAGHLYVYFYAKCAALDKAEAVLNWMSEKHIEKWGSGHENTCLHYARTIKLLRSWGRQEHAELLVYKILDDTGDSRDEDFVNFIASQPRNSLADIDLEQSFPETDDPNSMSRQLDKIDLAVMTGIAGFEDILKVIIMHCKDKADDPSVSLQACRAKCSLAKLHMNAGNVEETRRVLKDAKSSLEPLLLVGEEPMPRTTLEAAKHLARMFFKIQDETSCNAVVDQVIASVESRRYILG
ncbi:rhomboid family, partial [Fusarium mundagurra]